jgi:DNA-binding HxlR family transcriptional regulator
VEPKITQRILIKALRKIKNNDLINRKICPQVPSKVEYSLTKKAMSLIPILDSLCDWGYKHIADDIEFMCEG